MSTANPAASSGGPAGTPSGTSLAIHELRQAYASGAVSPTDVIGLVFDRIAARGADGIWINLVSRAEALDVAASVDVDTQPLAGIPFAVKDNIDVAGLATTAASPEFSYEASESATAVTRLKEAGAILIGKTNMDQFATGLSGARSPYGIPVNPFDARYIPGGSSSGSAAAVAAGIVSFAIGTDTAGSGRVPAALTGTVGIKPSRGLASTSGLVPACRSLDCPSVFSHSVADGAAVLNVIAGTDAGDPWSRDLPVPPATVVPRALAGVRLAVPALSTWHDSDAVGFQAAWSAVIDALAHTGAEVVEIDMEPFFAAGRLLYEGAWIAERMSAVQPFLESHADAMEPSVRALLQRGHHVTGADVFRAWDELKALRVKARRALEGCDALATPTTPTTFTIEQMLAHPIVNNAVLGRFTTFTNLLDMAAVAVPAGNTAAGLPFGISVQGPAGRDGELASLASALHTLIVPAGEPPVRAASPRPPAESALRRLTVVGAHLRGMPLHPMLVELGARFVKHTRTAREYRLYALADTDPAKPGLVRTGESGAAIDVEVYDIPITSVGALLATMTAPLGLGSITLADGTHAHGFVCEAHAVASAVDITEFGGWRAYLDHATPATRQ